MKDTESKVKEFEVKLANYETELEESEKVNHGLTEEVDRLRASEVGHYVLQIIVSTNTVRMLLNHENFLAGRKRRRYTCFRSTFCIFFADIMLLYNLNIFCYQY